MGYYTYYSINIYDQNLNQLTHSIRKSIIKELHVLYNESVYAIDEYGVSIDSVKWYDCYDNIKEFSKRFPWLIFRIDAESEASDEAMIYIKNGKLQDCMITKVYEEYDESKLQ